MDLSYETNIEKPMQDYLEQKKKARHATRCKQLELQFGNITKSYDHPPTDKQLGK